MDRVHVHRCLLIITLACLIVAAQAGAHSEPPPPPPPPPTPPVITDLVRVKPLRWSWLHWWEANRDPYLTTLAQTKSLQENLLQVDPDLRLAATDALLAGLEDDESYVRYHSALALGRMRETRAFEALKLRLETDTHESVQFSAIVALGLIGDEPSRALLLRATYQSDFLRDAGIRAMGLADEPLPPATTEGLRKLVIEGKPPYANAALWALSRHEGNADLYRNTLLRTQSPWLAGEAILALGPLHDPQGDRLIVMLATLHDQVDRIPSWALLRDVDAKKLRIGLAYRNSDNDQKTLRDDYIVEHRRVFDLMPRALGLDQFYPDYKDQRVEVGIEKLYQARLRATAAMALEHVAPDTSLPALHALIQERDDDDGFNVLPKCFAAISLGRIGSPKSLPILMEIVDERQKDRAKTSEETKSPLRGFAALALGFYAQPEETPQGPTNRPGYDKACELLAARIMDKREQQEVRAACAVALGLSRRTQNLRPLIIASESLDAQDDYLLIGYVILTRAMLGDQNILDPAMNVIASRPHRDETTDILARRAAVLAMGVHGGDEAIPRLVKVWDERYFVNREVILALSLCRAPGVSTTVVPILQESAKFRERAFMAMVLGELFVEDRPEALAHCLNDRHFPMRDPAQRPYRTIVNEFLYDYLLAEFGYTWY